MPVTTDTDPAALASAADLERFLADHDRALVMLYTEGCSICASMEPVLSLVARSVDAGVATLNPRDDPPLVERFDVRSVPTLVLFADGEEIDRLAEGFAPAEDLVAFVNRDG